MKKLVALVSLCTLALTVACSKKTSVPGEFAMVPGDADIVGILDAKAVLDYVKGAVPKLIPAELKDKVPPLEVMMQQAMQMTGIDINKLTKVIFVGYAGSEEKMAFIAQGIEAKNLKGTKEAEHNGVAIYSMPEQVHYAEIQGQGIVGAPSVEMVKKVLDAAAGKGQKLAGSERAKLLGELAGLEKDLGQLRVYLLTGNLPNTPPDLKLRGGAFFFDVDKGLAGTMLGDEAGAQKVKQQLDMGLMTVRMAMSMPAEQSGMPVKLDDETKQAVAAALNKIEATQKGGQVTVAYRGDLKPLIEKAVAFAIKQQAAGGTKVEAKVSSDGEAQVKVNDKPVTPPAEPAAAPAQPTK